ncbi:hypothetical protein DOY81_005437 [Sarcophaga bullata]|nr:hypothetical protein DOY81_005437 [Sarcophaga bullata]
MQCEALEHLNDITYTFISKRRSDIQRKIVDIDKISNKYGLKINAELRQIAEHKCY